MPYIILLLFNFYWILRLLDFPGIFTLLDKNQADTYTSIHFCAVFQNELKSYPKRKHIW